MFKTVRKRAKKPPGYIRETDVINENKKKHGGTVHKFTPAKWTHPNGHPRCLMCGQEQSFSPECNRAATPEEEAAVMESWGFTTIDKAKNPLWDGDGRQLPGQPRDPKTGEWIDTGGAARRVVRAAAKAAKLPGNASMTQRNKANAYASQHYPENEQKYAGLVVRLAGKGKAQEPSFRGQMSERYGIPANRLVEIENEMYEQMWPRKKKISRDERKNQAAGAKFLSAAQSRALVDVGARAKPVRIVPKTDRQGMHPDLMVKANSGPHKGSYVRISSNGAVQKVPSRSVDKMKRESKTYWDARDARERAEEAKRRAAPKPKDELSTLIREEREARRKRAQKILREMGMDENDSFNQVLITGDKDLLRSDKEPQTPEQKQLADLRFDAKVAADIARATKNPGDKEAAKRKKEAVSEFLEQHPELKRTVNRRKKAPELTRDERAALNRLDREMDDWRDGNISEPSSNRKAKKPSKKKVVVRRTTPTETPTETPKPKRKPTKKTTSTRRVAREKRKPLEFDMASGLPLSTAKKPNKKYTPKKYANTEITPKVRKATRADFDRLFGEGKNPPRGRENIRVPVKPMKPGFGQFDYMYDHHEVKNKGKVTPNKKQRTQAHDQESQRRKFEKIERLAEHMPELDSRIKKEADTDDTAAAVAMMRILGMRPSSDKGETRLPKRDKNGDIVRENGEIVYDDPIATFGATTLRREHITIDGRVVSINLTGKAGHQISIRTDDPTIVSMLKKRMSKKGKPSDKLFNTTEKATADYIKETFPDASNKDLRTYVATEIARRTIKQLPPPTSVAEFKDRVSDVTETTANQLQHAPSMSKNSYVAPGVFREWANLAGVDYELYENPLKGRNRQIKPIGWESRQRRKSS